MTEKNAVLKVLFIGKSGDHFSEKAGEYIKNHFESPEVIFSKRTDPFPEKLLNWRGDLLVSYLSQWIIPQSLLQKASFAAINFHPGPPEYPGIGCTNFAVYNRENEFGITCHHMLAKVDTGSIICVKRFALLAGDTVYSITQRCYETIHELFIEIMENILANDKPLPESHEEWTRKPYTRKQLNELCLLKPGMNAEEVKLRLKATTYGNKIWAQFQEGEKIISYEEAREKGLI